MNQVVSPWNTPPSTPGQVLEPPPSKTLRYVAAGLAVIGIFLFGPVLAPALFMDMAYLHKLKAYQVRNGLDSKKTARELTICWILIGLFILAVPVWYFLFGDW